MPHKAGMRDCRPYAVNSLKTESEREEGWLGGHGKIEAVGDEFECGDAKNR